ncbi:MBL fold metallo-hydrolase [Brevibacillus sp. AG]|uniref:MBL fold metallo-hydrolase n=1 Tax=Brevibacillus sp. AG TaxID=3020891 RepID=UPI00232F9AD1|nr:MBL fold metallo-hydrolase [Brevibacillus sp. AG]MDC0764228.1 MBL fold metallo-hydrolase [Brevibacillus sp. AG]
MFHTKMYKLFFSALLCVLMLNGCASSNASTEATPAVNATNAKTTTSNTTDTTSTTASSSDQKPNQDQSNNSTVTTTSTTNGILTVHFIDVGQGGSQLIISPTGKTILIDAGNNDKEQVVTDYLKKENVKKVDILIGTHPDADHTGGMDAVIRNFEIGKVYMPKVQSNTKTFESVITEIAKKGLKVSTAKAGLKLEWEPNASVEMIAPIGTYQDANEMSAVIHLTYGNNSFLFMGDAEGESESDLLKSQVNIKSDVLLVGHHGSKTSTSQEFLDKVNPSYAVIQSGKGNKYGHPTDAVLNRLSEKGIKIYRNDEQGNIVFTSNGTDISVSGNDWKPIETKNSSDTSTLTGTTPSVVSPKQVDSVYYKNCSEAKAAGAAPLHKGDPGYRSGLDRDNDGVACEK